jgi:CheY-like chemotaxis protein
MTELHAILLAEDNADDVELTLAALKANHVATQIIVARDGAEALDYLRRRGPYADRPSGNPVLILLD